MASDMQSTIQQLQNDMQRYKRQLSESEYLTCNVLVDPVLDALGWNILDGQLVKVQYNYPVKSGKKNRTHRADYALWRQPGRSRDTHAKPVCLVEVKSLDEQDLEKYIRERAPEQKPHTYYQIFTDGDTWTLFDTQPANLNPDCLRLTFRISELLPCDPANKFAEMAELLRSSDLTELGWVPLAAFLPPLQRSAKTKQWIAITERTPKAIKFPGVDKKPVDSWRQVVEHTASWLCHKRKLPIGKEITRREHGDSPILVATTVPQKGNQWKPIGNPKTYVNTRNSYTSAIENTKALLDACGVDPESVYLQSQQ